MAEKMNINELTQQLKELQRVDGTFSTAKIQDELERARQELDKQNIALTDLTKTYDELYRKKLDNSQKLSAAEEEQLKAIENYKETLEKIEKIYGNTKASSYFKKAEDGLNKVSRIYGSVVRAGRGLTDSWGKASQAAADYAKAVGLSGKAMDEMRKQTINATARGIAASFNYSSDELMKLMERTTRSLGRNVAINNEGMKNLAAMSRTLGEDTATEMIARLENFGVSVNEAGSRAGKMFAEASKSGISMEKYSKNFVDNIKLAQNYTFKNGLKGLSDMAKKATELKLDMGMVASFAEKVNTVEGALTTGAKLQVLGGSFAQMASPLQMLGESINDMEGLQDRLISMVGNLGRFNRNTGEVEVSAFNKYRIRTAAEAMGVDYGGLMESVNAQARRNEIARQLPSGVSKEVADLVKNIGVIENGVAGVNLNGEFKAASQISNDDLKVLKELNRSENEDIKDIAVRLRGWEEKLSGIRKGVEAQKAQLVENSGFGKLISGIASDISQSKIALMTIAGWQITKSVLDIGSTIFSGNGFGRGRGMGRAGAFLSRGSTLSRARGFVQAGGSMKSFRALTKIAGLLSKGGPIALGIGAAVAAVWGINKLIKNKQEKEIKRLSGVDLQGKYTSIQQGKILNYLKDDKKMSEYEFSLLPKKVQEKMIESGDAEALGINVKNKATGGIVRGRGTGTSDSIPAMLSNGESIMTAAATSRYGDLLSALNQSVGGNPIRAAKGGTVIKPRTFSYGGYVAPTAPAPTMNNGGVMGETRVHVTFDDMKVNMPDGTIREIGSSLLKDSTFERNLIKNIEQGLVMRSTGGPYKVTKAYSNI